MSEEEHNKIIDFVNSDDFMLLDSYISKPYEETIIEQDKEIERLNNQLDFIKDQNKYIDKLEKMVKERNSIIKEAKEYLPKLRTSSSYELDDKIDNLEEILDKTDEADSQ